MEEIRHQKQRERDRRAESCRCYTDFGDAGRGQKPSKADGLLKPTKARERILPWSFQKEHSPTDTLILDF